MTKEKQKKVEVTPYTATEALKIQAEAVKRSSHNFSTSARIGISIPRDAFPAISAIIRKDVKE